MTENTEEKLKKIFLETLQIGEGDFGFDKSKSEFSSWDSLAHMQIISEIESVFGVSLQMDEVVDVQKPSDLLCLIEKKGK